ncbi:MAG: GNAT family N-acetyltransferase [Hyphomicrobiales bacterium]|nr:MAG: GNAT family N-acetyltransferase [Hyphomicrobiales bacterium]
MTQTTLAIRLAAPADAVEIARTHDASWRYAYRGVIEGAHLEKMIARRGPAWWKTVLTKGRCTMVLEMSGKIAGYVTFGPNRLREAEQEGEIYELYLRPEYQGLGFGRALFNAARGELKRLRYAGLAVRALEANEPANAFYKALGGSIVGQRHELIGRVVMRLNVFSWD